MVSPSPLLEVSRALCLVTQVHVPVPARKDAAHHLAALLFGEDVGCGMTSLPLPKNSAKLKRLENAWWKKPLRFFRTELCQVSGRTKLFCNFAYPALTLKDDFGKHMLTSTLRLDGFTSHLSIDYRTGRPTSIVGDVVSPSDWRACSDLNRGRASAIIKASREHSSGKPVSADVWADHIARESEKVELPLIPFSAFGLQKSDEGFLFSSLMTRLREGKEAVAWKDNEEPVVYKFFNLYVKEGRGHLGQQLCLRMDDDYSCSAFFEDADLHHVLEKLSVLHDAGACPTEIVGLTEGGYFLVVKQPFCQDFKNFDEDRRAAIENMKAVVPTGSYRQTIAIFSAWKRVWAVGDLHTGNIRRMRNGVPVVIDALVGEVSPNVFNSSPAIQRAYKRAHEWRVTGRLPQAGELVMGKDEEL